MTERTATSLTEPGRERVLAADTIVRENAADSELRVLLIEDSEADAELTIRRLKAAGFNCVSRCVSDERDMRRELKAARPDVILSDFSIPGFDGMTALAIARMEAAGVPFIFLSGTIGEERAIEALKCGASGYVLKGGQISDLTAAVHEAAAG